MSQKSRIARGMDSYPNVVHFLQVQLGLFFGANGGDFE
jgi:hypothetical protein